MAGVKVTSRSGFRALEKYTDEVGEAICDEVGAWVEGRVKERMTSDRDSRGFTGRVQSGTTRQATIAEETVRVRGGWSQLTTVKPPQDIAGIIIEKGRRRGKGVSRAGQRMIERWAKRKLGPVSAGGSGRFKPGGRVRAERSRAYLIARAIKRRGIPALRPFAKTKAELKTKIVRMAEQVMARFRRERGKR